MGLSPSRLADIKAKTLSKIMRELELADKEDKVNEFLDKYGIIIEEESIPVQPRTMKILVLGALAGKLKDFQIAAKKCGIPEDNIQFVDDYDVLKRISVAKLEYSNVYSDIVYGPNPHSQTDMGDTTSLLALMKKEPHKFPRIIEARANDRLKITISNFKNAILSTRYWKALDE